VNPSAGRATIVIIINIIQRRQHPRFGIETATKDATAAAEAACTTAH